ncbi:MAG: hypothetical protein CSA79_05185 [Thiothrix nivea]|nr:MAG: hypothetical protein CSA79_05185 [Thiothrix nivea]
MRTRNTFKSLALTCCAVSVLMAAEASWAIDNCAQVTAQTENDADSTPGNKADSAAILAAVNSNTDLEDDEACAPVQLDIVHDFGDAPDSYGTTAASNGARHEVVPWLMLGNDDDDLTNDIDSENDGQPGNTAGLDDSDESSITGLVLTAGEKKPVLTATKVFNGSGADAYLACWVDYDGNGVFDPAEYGYAIDPAFDLDAYDPDNDTAPAPYIIPTSGSRSAPGSVNNLRILMPAVPAGAAALKLVDTNGDGELNDADNSATFARCRLSNQELQDKDGQGVLYEKDTDGDGTNDADIADGEVEDYVATFDPLVDISLEKTVVDPDTGSAVTSVQRGDTVVYVLTARNAGPANASNVTINDLLPAGVSYVANDAADNGMTYDNASGEWVVGDIPANESRVLKITVTID